MPTFRIFDIDWHTDGDQENAQEFWRHLPDSDDIEADDEQTAIDTLVDKYGCNICSAQIQEI
jgi:hypothetical protein